MRLCSRLVMALAFAAASLPAQNLMPWPASLSVRQGKLLVDQSFRIALTGYQEPRLPAAAARLVARLARQTGMPLDARPLADAARATLVLQCQQAGDDESYHLSVTPRGARLEAPSPLGILRGLETFLQLVEMTPDGFAAPAVEIQDQPRLAWRGLLIDVSRHFIPLDVLKRNLDGMAAVKMNVLHWHLSDDQGFRVESQRYPRLHEMGSDGLYFTQDQVRELIAYARERGIRVVPEFDVPGHTSSWFPGYPELSAGPGPYQIERSWGVFHRGAMDPTKEEVYEFLDGFIGEMAALFPDDYFHIGGDEVSAELWDASPRIVAFKQEQGLKSNQDVQAYFNRRLQAIVKKHGKKMVGWDEILHPDLPHDVVIHSWRGEKSLAEARELGFTGLLSAGYYLDHIRPASYHYAIDPQGAIGGEACMWSEYVTAENIDSRIWPRTAAIAERFWSPAEVKDVGSLYRRLAVVSRELEWLGLTHRSSYRLMLERLAGSDPIGPLQTLADVLEPVKLYARAQSRQYTTQMPLNRLVDATRPESDTAREFAQAVERFLGGARTEADGLARQLTLWRDNEARLGPTLQRSALLAEVAPLSRDLSAISAAGLQALRYLRSGRAAPASWRRQRLNHLKRASEPRAELLILVAPPIQELIERSGRARLRR